MTSVTKAYPNKLILAHLPLASLIKLVTLSINYNRLHFLRNTRLNQF